MKRTIAIATVLLAAPLVPAGLDAQVTRRPSGFNLFSVQQDVEIGRQSAAEAERQLRLLQNRNVDAYLNRIIQRLAAQAPGADYPYQIKAVNAPEINAFAFPGGPMYVNRGLIEAARNEAELAGVLAHEMSHVAMRHGTHQASKAYLSKAGLGILGGLLGKSSSSKILNTIGGVGLNAVFLKFSRDDEYEADEVGAEILARAGYDPTAMATLFELLQAEQGRNPSKLEQFFSSHPPPAGRGARIRQQAATLGSGRTQVLGGFATIKATLRGLPAAPSQQLAAVDQTSSDPVITGPISVRVEQPSTRFLQFAQPNGFFTIDYPDNWRAYPSGHAVSLAPEGGVVTGADGQTAMLYGVIVNHYTPFNGPETRRSLALQRNYAPFEDRAAVRGALEDATDDLVNTIIASNPYLRSETGSARSEMIDGAAGFSLVLSGTSPITGQGERVTVYTRGLPDGHVLYALAIVPETQASGLDSAFGRMIRSLRVNDEAAHRDRTALRSGQD
jgi:Zn-dependent protease with chaperone function